MLSWRLHTGPEKAELQELNARLYDYVCRVRELERENLLLEEELRGRRGQEGLWAEGQARFAEEARGLRQQLDELSWATALAEGERDALRRELWELQRLGEEERAARGRLDAELGAQRRELQEALGARAALEALLGRLQAERRGLEAAHEQDVRELRARAARLTMSYRARATGPAAPPPRLREVHDSYALLVAESWRETVQLYEDEVRELEDALRRGQESRREAEEETRLCAQEAEALRREALELEQLRALLEEELRRVQEEYELQAEERQVRARGPPHPGPLPVVMGESSGAPRTGCVRPGRGAAERWGRVRGGPHSPRSWALKGAPSSASGSRGPSVSASHLRWRRSAVCGSTDSAGECPCGRSRWRVLSLSSG